MAVNKSSAAGDLARDREAKAWELRCKGWTMRRIAAELGVTAPGVKKMLDRTAARLEAEIVANIGLYKVEQHQRLEHLYSQAMQEWDRSKKAAAGYSKVSGKVHVSKEGEITPLPDQVTKRLDGRLGDPRYLAQATAALEAQRALWGLNAQKDEAGGPSCAVKAVSGIDLEKLWSGRNAH